MKLNQAMIQFLLLFILLTINHKLRCGFFRGHISGQLLLTHTLIYIYVCLFFFFLKGKGAAEKVKIVILFVF